MGQLPTFLTDIDGWARNVSTIVRQPGREIKLSSFGPWPVG